MALLDQRDSIQIWDDYPIVRNLLDVQSEVISNSNKLMILQFVVEILQGDETKGLSGQLHRLPWIVSLNQGWKKTLEDSFPLHTAGAQGWAANKRGCATLYFLCINLSHYKTQGFCTFSIYTKLKLFPVIRSPCAVCYLAAVILDSQTLEPKK